MIYFGTKQLMQWLRAPSVDADTSKQGYSSGATQYLEGGMYVRRSKTSAKTFSLSWPLGSAEDTMPFSDYADGQFGTGYLYMLTPFAMDTNALPAWWAAPWMAAVDGPSLAIGSPRPSLVGNSDFSRKYPAQAAVFQLATTVVTPSIHIPIPKGYVAWVGVHGTATGTASVRIVTFTGAIQNASTTAATLLGVNTATRVANQVSGDAFTGVGLAITGTGVLTLHGVIIQILKAGVTPKTGDFISGRGQSGLEFTEHPTLNEYNAPLDLVGATAELLETEGFNHGR